MRIPEEFDEIRPILRKNFQRSSKNYCLTVIL